MHDLLHLRLRSWRNHAIEEGIVERVRCSNGKLRGIRTSPSRIEGSEGVAPVRTVVDTTNSMLVVHERIWSRVVHRILYGVFHLDDLGPDGHDQVWIPHSRRWERHRRGSIAFPTGRLDGSSFRVTTVGFRRSFLVALWLVLLLPLVVPG